MSRLRLAVVGAGHLGRIHARLAASIPAFDLIGIVDPSSAVRSSVADEFQVPVHADCRDVLDNIDAAIVATPTQFHDRVALELIRHGVHVLVEKPLAPSVDEAKRLVAAAEDYQVTLQVGHIERFNPAYRSALPWIQHPKYIEATRTSGYTFRSTDIGVVFDLMIHDIDIILSLVDSEVRKIHALGVSVLGKHEDMAQARLEFENGCVANLSASRTSFSAQRSMQIFSGRDYVGLDFAVPSACHIRPDARVLNGDIDIDRLSPAEREYFKEHLFQELLPVETLPLTKTNALVDELEDFAACIAAHRQPQVTGKEALDNIQVAEQILAKISQHNEEVDRSGLPEGHLSTTLTQTNLTPIDPWHHAQDKSQHRKAG